MTNLRPYPVYKSSDVEWLGKIPGHWKSQRLRSVAQLAASNVDKIQVEGEQPVRLCNYTDVYNHHRITDEMAFMLGTATKEETRRFSLRSGDVMFTKDSESFDDIGIPAVAGTDLENVVLGYHLMLARPGISLYGPYLAWFFTSKQNRWQFEVSANGVTRFGMPQSGFKDAVVSLPPLDEQRAIADFLDVADARITRYIAAKRRMIALLEELKQASINQAVTRGLDPDVPLKPSGVDWLGDTPAHWEVKRGSSLFSERNQTGFPTLPILEVSLVSGVTVRDLKNSQRKQQMSDRDGYKKAEKGDLPYNMMRMWQGAVGLAPVTGLVSPAYVVLIPNQGVSASFFARLFKTEQCKAQFSRVSRGIVSDRDRLYWESFRQIHFAVPPFNEQTAIAAYTEQASRSIDGTATKAKREIELVQEYRTRLISDVVTGRLDVRGVELPAPEDVFDASFAID